MNCNDNLENDGNCDGKCVRPMCFGNLTIHSPHFATLHTAEVAGTDATTAKFGIVFAPLPNVYGEVELEVKITDGGTRDFRGKNTFTGTIVLKLIEVNEGPTFTVHKLRLLESSILFLHSFPGMIAAFNGVHQDQMVSFEILWISDFGSLFQSRPTVGPSGTLEFHLRPFTTGSAQISILATDDGSVEHGGQNSTNCLVDVNVLPVNTRPTFSIPPTVLAVEDVSVNLPRFAKNLSQGSKSEYWQTLKFHFLPAADTAPHDAFRLFDGKPCDQLSQCREDRCVGARWQKENVKLTTPEPSVVHFSGYEVTRACNGSFPYISPDGDLIMRPARDQHGVAFYTVLAQDDGGIAFGGHENFSVPLILKVLPQPRVFGVSPRIGPACGNNLITIQGQYFGSTYSRGYKSDVYEFASVSVGGTECLEHEYISDSEILCRPASGAGSGAVMVEIDDTDSQMDPSVSTLKRAGALEARQGYRHSLFVAGGSVRARDAHDLAHGVLGLGPSGHRIGGTLEQPTPSMDPMEFIASSAVTAVAVHQGLVYAGGGFVTVTVPETGKLGPSTSTVNRIFRYDGNYASALGAGTNGEIAAIRPFQGHVVVGGAFTEVYPERGGAIPTGGLALWNPVSEKWNNMPGLPTSTFPGVVMALAALDDILVVGGKFDRFSASTKDFRGLAIYNGSSHKWSSVGTGVFGGHVLALALNCTALDSAADVKATTDKKEHGNGTNISPGTCRSEICLKCRKDQSDTLACDASKLVFAGGTFSRAGEREARGIAMWDGSDWNSIGNLDGEVHALSLLSGWLYVGGTFTGVQFGQIGTPYGRHLDVDYVARYRDGAWQSLGSGVGGPVYALVGIRNCMYVGGVFDRVCDSKEVVAARAHRCAQEKDAENFQVANGIARMCYHNQSKTHATDHRIRWESVTTHDRQTLDDEARIRALASFDAHA